MSEQENIITASEIAKKNRRDDKSVSFAKRNDNIDVASLKDDNKITITATKDGKVWLVSPDGEPALLTGKGKNISSDQILAKLDTVYERFAGRSANTGSDPNSFAYSGIYRIGRTTHARKPMGATDTHEYSLFVQRIDNNITQVAIATDGIGDNLGKIFIRARNNNVWSKWKDTRDSMISSMDVTKISMVGFANTENAAEALSKQNPTAIIFYPED